MNENLDPLLKPEGQALLGWLAAEQPQVPVDLPTHERLRRRYPPQLVTAALQLYELRVRARTKFRLADQMYLTRAGLEQASSEPVARHRARRYDDRELVADLCTGIGGDLVALASGRAVVAADHNPVHLRMAELNAAVYGCDSSVDYRCTDVQQLRLPGRAAVFVDPARRVGGRRLRAGESSPSLAWCLGLAARHDAVGIKAAPGLPLGLVPAGWEVECISWSGGLKDAALWSPPTATVSRRATVLDRDATMVAADGPDVPCLTPGRFLFDPDPAVTRAGLVTELARSLGAWRVDARVAFLSCDQPVATPFARTLEVLASMPFGVKALRSELRRLGVGAVDVRKRGSAVDVDELTRRLRPVGDAKATVVLTRVRDRPWTFVCADVPRR